VSPADAAVAPRRPRRALDLTNPQTVRAVARRAGLQRSRKLGQHFLIDRGTLDDIVAALELSEDAEVLEIGCGVGTLTGELARRARRVVAVDVDDACVRATTITQRDHHNVTVIRADARHLDPAELGMGAGWVLTGNLPYQLTGVLLTRFFELPTPPSAAVFLVQREVAARLCAPTGDWSLATVAVRSLADLECLRTVPPDAFDPQPKVHSALLRMRPAPGLDAEDRAAVIALARPVFQARRKTLRHGVANALEGDVARAGTALEAAGIDPQRRPGTLHLDEWQRLVRAVRQVRGQAD
jgi:16S rRNA (adenine1518-N6/adenine1519-N6)-dimethyltransferase